MSVKRLLGLAMIVAAGVSLGAACSPAPLESAASQTGAVEHHSNSDQHNSSMVHMHLDPPQEYANLTNPLLGNPNAIEAGKVIFETNCVVCHGELGKGDGPGAAALNPKPADLSDKAMMGGLSDSYLFWRVSEGGTLAPFNSAMPAWKGLLSEEQRWQAVTYLRTFSTEGAAPNHEADDHHADDEHGHD